LSKEIEALKEKYKSLGGNTDTLDELPIATDSTLADVLTADLLSRRAQDIEVMSEPQTFRKIVGGEDENLFQIGSFKVEFFKSPAGKRIIGIPKNFFGRARSPFKERFAGGVPTPARKSLQRLIDYAVSNDNQIAIPVQMQNSVVSDTILNELALRFGKENISETLVKKGDVHYRLIDVNTSLQNKSRRIPQLTDIADDSLSETLKEGVLGESAEIVERAFRENNPNWATGEKLKEVDGNLVAVKVPTDLAAWIGSDDLPPQNPKSVVSKNRVTVRQIEPITQSNIESFKSQLEANIRDLSEAQGLGLDLKAQIQELQNALDEINLSLNPVKDQTSHFAEISNQGKLSISIPEFETPFDVPIKFERRLNLETGENANFMIADVTSLVEINQLEDLVETLGRSAFDTQFEVIQVLTNAIVRKAAEYSDVQDVKFVMRSDAEIIAEPSIRRSQMTADRSPSLESSFLGFIKRTANDVFERWAARDNTNVQDGITPQMRESVPQRGFAFERIDDLTIPVDDDGSLSMKQFFKRNAHMLETIMGDNHYQKVARHFDHGVRADGKLVMTRRGSEQFAEAMENFLLYEDVDTPIDIRVARPFIARQINKISKRLGRIAGAVSDNVNMAQQLVAPPIRMCWWKLIQELLKLL
jgi:hypothetical protein